MARQRDVARQFEFVSSESQGDWFFIAMYNMLTKPEIRNVT